MVQRNLDNTNKELHDLKENYIQVISKLKEREAIISKMKASGNNSSPKASFVVWFVLLIFSWTESTLIDRAKGLRSDLQHASNDISSLFTRLGTCCFLCLELKTWSLSSADFHLFLQIKRTSWNPKTRACFWNLAHSLIKTLKNCTEQYLDQCLSNSSN